MGQPSTYNEPVTPPAPAPTAPVITPASVEEAKVEIRRVQDYAQSLKDQGLTTPQVNERLKQEGHEFSFL